MEKICFYCQQKANYQLKNGKYCCSKSANSCITNRTKNANAVSKAHELGKYKDKDCKTIYENLPIEIKEKMKWNKGLTKETDKRVKKYGETKTKNILEGKTKPSFKDKHHKKETKQIMSAKAIERNNGHIKTKYYEIFCKFLNKFVKVQGTYELMFAEFLNDNNILWTREKRINLKYKLFEDDYWHTYYPDFYLINNSQFIEIKGYWFKSFDNRVNDKRKMKAVFKYNKEKNIKIITKRMLDKIITKVP